MYLISLGSGDMSRLLLRVKSQKITELYSVTRAKHISHIIRRGFKILTIFRVAQILTQLAGK